MNILHRARVLVLCALLFLIALALQSCGGTPNTEDAIGNVINRANTTTKIKDIRMWHAPQRSRIVFDVNRQLLFNVFPLKNPPRVVIDLTAARVTGALPQPEKTGQFIKKIRRGTPKKNITRLVFDLNKPVRYFIQMLPPGGGYQHRLVVDFYHRDAVVEADTVTPVKPQRKKAKPKKAKGKLLVLIDPGHGGEDSGARGRRTREKKVVLAIAKKLRDRINKLPNLRAELTRNGDYYVGLRKRTRIARNRQADLFVSIHADAFHNKAARGASVYALSRRGASSETAKWLANKENAADLVGGVTLADKDNQLAGVLLDLSMTETVNESLSFGRDVLGALTKIGRVHSKRVEQAGFAVLKSPDIPSILIETAYITNPREEKLLMNAKHQHKIAAAIVAGIRRYVAKNASRYAGE